MNEKECMFETMKSEILAILALPPSAGYTWKGTTTDLLEVINAVVMRYELIDDTGQCYTFGRLTHTFVCVSTAVSLTIRVHIWPKRA